MRSLQPTEKSDHLSFFSWTQISRESIFCIIKLHNKKGIMFIFLYNKFVLLYNKPDKINCHDFQLGHVLLIDWVIKTLTYILFSLNWLTCFRWVRQMTTLWISWKIYILYFILILFQEGTPVIYGFIQNEYLALYIYVHTGCQLNFLM